LNKSGNRNRHHDPPPELRKLLCFGDRVWAALRGAVESLRGGGEEKEEKLQEELIKEIEIRQGNRRDLPMARRYFSG